MDESQSKEKEIKSGAIQWQNEMLDKLDKAEDLEAVKETVKGIIGSVSNVFTAVEAMGRTQQQVGFSVDDINAAAFMALNHAINQSSSDDVRKVTPDSGTTVRDTIRKFREENKPAEPNREQRRKMAKELKKQTKKSGKSK